jgi:hypothetical protein
MITAIQHIDRLAKRLNADVQDEYAAMLIYARYFNLPFIEEDLIEYMEFWVNKSTHSVYITLVTDSKEVHRTLVSLGGNFLYAEMIAYI